MANKFIVRLGTTSALATNGGAGTIAIGDTYNLDQTESTTDQIHRIRLGDTYKTTSSTLVNSARNSKGVVISTVVRAGIRKIELGWKVIRADEYAKLGTFFNTNFDFYVYYFDTDTMSWLTKHCYVGDRVVSAVKNKQIATNSTGGGLAVEYYEGFKISLIEM